MSPSELAAHHGFSPSRLGRRFLCPGSHRMEGSGPPGPTTEAAEEGRILHAWMARTDWTVEELEEAPGAAALTDEQLYLLKSCRAYETGYLRDWNEADPIYREIGMELHEDGGRLLSRGTADLLGISSAPAIVRLIDYKFGRNPLPEAAATLQLSAYAGMALQKFPRVPVCAARIYQPRLRQEWQGIFARESDGLHMTLAEVVLSVAEVISRGLAADAPLHPSLEACEFCSARASCPALRETVVRANETPITAPAFAALTPGKRRDVLETAVLAEKWAPAVKALAREFMVEGGHIPGFALETRSGRREIQDIPAAFAAVSDVLSQPEFLDCTTVSVSRLEETYAEKAKARGGGTKKEWKSHLAAALAQFMARAEDTLLITRVKEDCQ